MAIDDTTPPGMPQDAAAAMPPTDDARAAEVRAEVQAALDKTRSLDLGQMGSQGLTQYGGFIQEEFLSQLSGKQGMRVFREMGDNDASCHAILFALDKIVRQVEWKMVPASGQPVDIEASDFVDSCRTDMETPWAEHISEVTSMFQYGYSVFEEVYKLRAGRNDNPAFDSKYADGRVGWRDLLSLSQDTIQNWLFDPNGRLMGLRQIAPPMHRTVDIPLERLLLFRTRRHKNNPQGMSILRGAYRSWYFKSRMEVAEVMGAEKDLVGIPIAGVPANILNPSAQGKERTQFNMMKKVLTGMRGGSQAAIMYPLEYDANGNKRWEIDVVKSAGARTYDTDKIITRYKHDIAMTVMAGFLTMNQTGGSFAMHKDASDLFLMALTTYLDTMADIYNSVAIPRLMSWNTFGVTEFPTLEHGGVGGVDMGMLGDYLLKLSQAGMPLFPNKALEKFILDKGGMPVPQEDDPTYAMPDPAEMPVEAPQGIDGVMQGVDGSAAPAADSMAAAQGQDPQAPQVVVQKSKFEEADHPRADNGEFGEGSGGGKDAKTQSGKTLHDANHVSYAALHKKQSDAKRLAGLDAAHPGFTAQDHRDASAHHGARADALPEGRDKKNATAAWQAHAHLAAYKEKNEKHGADSQPRAAAAPPKPHVKTMQDALDAHPSASAHEHLAMAKAHRESGNLEAALAHASAAHKTSSDALEKSKQAVAANRARLKELKAKTAKVPRPHEG